MRSSPFISALRSHGGGTPDGQREILRGYGITEEFCGCPIRASMETIVVCQTREGFPVHFDNHASQADHVLVVGRVKPHTELFGDHQSGLMKMLLIGLGKHEGAKIYHRAFVDHSFDHIVRSVGRRVIEKGRILAGLGIVENAYDQTGLIRAVLPHEFEAQDRELLALAVKWLPRLPFDHADLLLVDEIGKEISGCGMDTNVIGRRGIRDFEDLARPRIRVIGALELSPSSQGNALGVGNADFITQRLRDAIDEHKTLINTLTTGDMDRAKIPATLPTDEVLIKTVAERYGTNRWAVIPNTLHLEEILVSQDLCAELASAPGCRVDPTPIRLNYEHGRLL